MACLPPKAAKPHPHEGTRPRPALTYLSGDLRSRRKEQVTRDGEARPLCPATLPTSCRQTVLGELRGRLRPVHPRSLKGKRGWFFTLFSSCVIGEDPTFLGGLMRANISQTCMPAPKPRAARPVEGNAGS